jgi:hypothetical protein
MSDLYEQAQERAVPDHEWRQMAGPARRSFDEFLQTMRSELALPAVSATFFRDGRSAGGDGGQPVG